MKTSQLRYVVAIASFILATTTATQAQPQITVLPANPTPGQPFQVEVASGTPHGPAMIMGTDLQVVGSTIRLQVSIDCGPWAMPDFYTQIFDVPPLAAGTYVVEFWEDQLYDPSPSPVLIDTEPLQLSFNPIPTLSLGGALLLALLIVAVAIRKIHG